MGFFKKIFKGVGKVFKKIGKGIKKAFMKFGKFMNKAGILGQVAMAFILPGIGSALGSMVGAAAASANPILAAAGKVMQFAGKVASAPGKVFSSITKGVTSTLTEFSKTALSKMGVEGKLVEGAAESFFFGPDSATSRVGTAIKAPFTEKAVLDAVDKTFKDTPEIFKEDQKLIDDIAKFSMEETTKPKGLLDKVVEGGKEVITEGVAKGQEIVTDKIEALGKPKEVLKAGFEVFKENREAQEAADSYGPTGEVIGLGEFGQDSFQTCPIPTFQVNNTSPISNYAQQVQSMLADQLTPSQNPFELMQTFNTGMTPRPVGGP